MKFFLENPSMITVTRWKYAMGLLLAFAAGWQFAPQFAATSWYRPVTSILIMLPSLGLLYVTVSQLIQENKKSPKSRP